MSDMSFVLLFELALLGIGSGFLAGLLGIGGGMVMVPVLTFLLSGLGTAPELAVKMAIATSMSAILFTSMSSVIAHHKRGAVRWSIVMHLAPGIVVGSLVSSLGAFALLKGSWLALFFSVFVIFSATQMFSDKKTASTRAMPGMVGKFSAGSAIGFLSGLVGAGGGFLSVPFMTWCNVAIHNAVATSAALGFPIALANVTGYLLSGQGIAERPESAVGYVWLPGLVVVAAFSVLTAPFGARAAHALPVKKLKRIFACILFLVAAYMFYTGYRGLQA
ncbi:sulfite exporter TauE/SafE family protein [Advenella mimigardefordensis]|uniref:Probable membrane transporter protein n=1 Tax=Advenella mimigardefordensis (strain DSM 17166 / LMG 22922 / DPN7) TaxID=1247726 RepID=W0PJQ4_ADVMD|nr:sulfite exporter TauE/SafE family protein [Advenella mimigardefordensis]AHG65208.1 putative transmembrane protein [Advenella mimigardefordensis DPN7]